MDTGECVAEHSDRVVLGTRKRTVLAILGCIIAMATLFHYLTGRSRQARAIVAVANEYYTRDGQSPNVTVEQLDRRETLQTRLTVARSQFSLEVAATNRLPALLQNTGLALCWLRFPKRSGVGPDSRCARFCRSKHDCQDCDDRQS